MAIIGPGALQQNDIQPDPMLNDATDFEYITILNPFTDDFQVQVAQDIPVNMPLKLRNPTSTVQNERDIAAQYGVPLKNPDHQGRQQIFNTMVIPAGQTRNFKGGEAQVVVRQIVNELLQREGKRRMMADPTTRHNAEQRVIISRGTIEDIMAGQLKTPTQQMTEAITKSNEVRSEETAFPGLKQTVQNDAAGSTDPGNETATSDKRTVRQAKTA